MKNFVVFIVFVCVIAFNSQAQKTNTQPIDDIELRFSPNNDTMYIKILDPSAKEFDLFIYLSAEKVKVNTHVKGNFYAVNIKDWERGLYHIKIDYNYVTQFRNIEIFE